MLKFIIYKARDGWRWHAIRRGRIVAESGEGYRKKDSLLATLKNFHRSIKEKCYIVREK